MSMNKSRFKNYYLGLDIGTNSVGWAVTYPNYSIANFNRKSMWGVRKFEEASTAEDTRLARTARRRLDRRKDRLNFLQDVFKETINKVDPAFFERMKNSGLHCEDKSVKTKNSLFDDKDYTDEDYYNEYPTIYHLRKHLMNTKEEQDPRLVYLALHHILKYRGHFLFEGDLKNENNFDALIHDFNEWTFNLFDEKMFDLNDEFIQEFANYIRDRNITQSDKQKWMKNHINKKASPENKKIFTQISRILAGLKVTDIGAIFIDKELEEKVPLEINSDDIEIIIDGLSFLNEDDKQLIYSAKAIFDWSILEEILRGERSISYAKAKSYEEHAKDLALLKEAVKGISSQAYQEMFDDHDSLSNYVAYIGQSTKVNNKSTASAEDFYKYVKKVIKNKDEASKTILDKIEKETFMPKQRTGSNGVIPHQVHLYELEQILENASNYLSLLNKKDDTGLSNKEKISSLFKFRIPYYIGPLNDHHKDKGGYAWVVRKKQGKVYPWNFDEMIDVSKSAEEFISRMTNTCTYIFDEDVLPKHSMLYQKFTVLNEINNIKIDGEPIRVEIKPDLYKDLFENRKGTVSKKTIIKWLQNNNHINKDYQPLITGIDDTVKSKLSTYHDMLTIFGDEMPPREVVDEIVRYNTLFSGDKSIFKEKVKEEFSDYVTEAQLEKLSAKTYAGWGRLSRKLLEEIADESHYREPTSIIQAMYINNYNLMELLSEEFDYSEKIEEINVEKVSKKEHLTYDMVEELYVSPSVKRAIWQTLKLIDEITSITEHEPQKIFIEMARGSDGSGRTQSRKNQLLELYKKIKEERELIDGLTASLENTEEGQLRSKKLYLYYTQLGKCMYSGESISIDQLFNKNLYDIDHIYPQSLTKDDSFTNKVLVKKNLNKRKDDAYPLSENLTISSETKRLWKFLKEKGLISETKYARLKRDTPLDSNELSGFIERQIVETRQSTKAVASILQKLYPNSEVIFTKAKNANELRQHIVHETGDRSYFKVRMMNDFHHAKDAYLNIVAGNVYHTKFTTNPLNFLRKAPSRSYNLANMYDRDVVRKDKVAWIAGKDGTIKKVVKTLKQNDILVTWLQTDGKGSLFDQTLMKKGYGQVEIKKGKSIDKYGGYNKAAIAYYAIVDHEVKNKRERWLVSIPIHISNRIHNEGDLISYLETQHEPQLENVKIIIDHIHARNQLIESEGIRGRITGKTSTSYFLRNEIEPIFTSKSVEILKEIEKTQLIDNYTSNELNDDLLEYLYNEFIELSNTELYIHRVGKVKNILRDNKDIFLKATTDEKTKVLNEILKIFKSTRQYGDLRVIQSIKSAGKLTIGRNLTKKRNFVLINQSISGLFENEVDVMQL